jgi:hypothetical protein
VTANQSKALVPAAKSQLHLNSISGSSTNLFDRVSPIRLEAPIPKVKARILFPQNSLLPNLDHAADTNLDPPEMIEGEFAGNGNIIRDAAKETQTTTVICSVGTN